MTDEEAYKVHVLACLDLMEVPLRRAVFVRLRSVWNPESYQWHVARTDNGHLLVDLETGFTKQTTPAQAVLKAAIVRGDYAPLSQLTA